MSAASAPTAGCGSGQQLAATPSSATTTPTHTPHTLAPPPPAAHPPSWDRSEPSPAPARSALSPAASHHDSVTFPVKSASMSSTATSSSTPISSIDLEKSGSLGREFGEPKSKRQSSTDPEKAAQSPTRHSRDRYSRENNARIAYAEEDDGDDTRALQEAKAAKILLFLAGPCVLLSALNTLWTIISLFITLLTQPVRLCARRPSFGQQLGGLLGPALNLQLRSIYTPLPPHADEDTSYRPGMLMMIMLLSPFFSMGMALAAWVTAVFWLTSAIVGDPAGMDKRDDGRETVLALRNWWERWLVGGMRDE